MAIDHRVWVQKTLRDGEFFFALQDNLPGKVVFERELLGSPPLT